MFHGISWLLSKLIGFLSRYKGRVSYGILRACRRCVYAKSYEPVVIVSLRRGPRVIVNLNGRTYVRVSECIGIQKCGKCLMGEVDLKELPCRWIEI